MRKRILVLGATGMLGASIFRGLGAEGKWRVTGTVRDLNAGRQIIESVPTADVVGGVDALQFETVADVIMATRPNVVINCIGVVRQIENTEQREISIELNSLFPHKVAQICSSVGARLIHFSTDCVFTGDKGGYREGDFADASDLYGRSKVLGEVSKAPHLILRTSIIGHEVGTAHSLVDWYLSQNDSVRGYRQAIFSGLPTVVISRILSEYILDSECSGVLHLSAAPINKFELLSLVRSTYGKGVPITPCDKYKVNKSLNSSKLKNLVGLEVDEWPVLISTMRNEYEQYFGDRL